MKKNTVLARCAVGLALLGSATASSSLTLGAVRGTVIVGQPLNLSFQLAVDATDDARSLCVVAEVFNGDTRVDPSRVSVSVDAPDAAGNAVARVRSLSVVDEAFVSINLRAGCVQTSSRRYVLLADVITDTVAEPAAMVVPSAPAVSPPAALPVPAPKAVAPLPGVGTAPEPGVAPRVAAPRTRPTTVAPAARPSAVSTPAAARPEASGAVKPVAPKPAPRTVAQPKLKLDPIEPMAAIDPNLRKSTELATTPSATPEKSAEAAALWRTLNAQPQDVLKEAQRLQGLEAEFKAFRDLTAKNQAELAARLAQADDQGKLANYFYVVSALLALALVLAAGLWWSLRRRVQAQRAWWEDREQVAKADQRLKAVAAGHTGGFSDSEAGRPANVDLNLGPDAERSAAPASSGSAASSKVQPPPTRPVAPALSRADQAEELFDIQQQADFFMSLGQTDQAIALLNNHIHSNEETGPMAYLDLLRIYHSTGRVQEYDALRVSFMRVFNASVPEFTAYGGDTRDLESYRGIVPSIQAAWGTPKAEKMLDEMVFRRPGSKWDHAFELAAYSDLLMLQGIAIEYTAASSGEPNAISTFSVLPTGRPDATGKAASSFGLDLDLGGPEPVVGNISAYLERSEPEFSSDAPTRPAGLSARAPVKDVAEPERADNLLDFDVDTPPDGSGKDKTKR